jgi:tRNA (adenine37-N6)-methyltransferase
MIFVYIIEATFVHFFGEDHSHPNAFAGYAQSTPDEKLTVEFSQKAQLILDLQKQSYPQLTELITQVISQDPRPAYKQNNNCEQTYGITLYHFNIKWKIANNHAIIENIYEEEINSK